MKTISIVVYIIVAIALVIFLIKDILSECKGDHNDCGKKLKYHLGLPGFLAIVFFLFFTGLWSGFFW
jgi:uncharacterized protein with PQ loop repeat